MAQSDPHLVDIREGHRFDEQALARYLGEVLPEDFPDAPAVRQFQGGQSNPTFLLESSRGQYVLRKKPPGELLPAAHLVEREYRVMAALRDTPVPVPEALHLCEDESIIGTPFYVMRFIKGRVFEEPELDGVDHHDRGAAYENMVDTLAALHQVDYQTVGLGDFGKQGQYIARQVRLWSKQYQAAWTGDHNRDMENLMAWLPDNIPDQDETTIAHGDFRPGNLMLHPEQPRVVAVLDWELCTLGHPLTDLAYFCIPYHLEANQPGMHGLLGLDIGSLGLPDEDQVVARYCRQTGRESIPHWPYYTAFALFRLASILQGVYKRGLDGNASSANALEMGKGASALARAAWREAQKVG
jgi:aminoglycoside phosphotransferase (APT) family kinase protein